MGRCARSFAVAPAIVSGAFAFDGWGSTAFEAVILALFALSVPLMLLREKAAAGARETTGPGVVEEHLGSFAERYSLTQRETMVLEKMIVEDETAKEIGRSLYISERSCRHHLTAIYEKAGVKNRAAVFIRGEKAGGIIETAVDTLD